MKKYLKWIFVIAILVSWIPVSSFVIATTNQVDLVVDDEISIVYENETVNKITLAQNQRRRIYVEGASESTNYQWQILMPKTEDEWIDIYQMKEDYCELSYALLQSMLDESGSVFLRCEMNDDGNTTYTDSVKVTISYLIDASEEDGNGLAGTFSLPNRTLANARASEYVTIEIKYLYEDNTPTDSSDNVPAFDSYTAYLQNGTSFTATVDSPTIVGYTPYLWDGDDDDDNDQVAQKINLDYTSLQENETIVIVYKPSLVTYKVRYYLQNTTDDLYTEDVSRLITTKGETGAFPNEDYVKAEIEGFTALYYQPETIAADGSTEFQCYYDRNYYLMYFDCGEGYGVEPVYARYGTPFVVNDPVRPGYLFNGWDLGVGTEDNLTFDGNPDDLPTTIPNENRTYQAIWSTTDTSYTVIYWAENADNENYSYLKSKEYDAVSATQITDFSSYVLDASILGEYQYFELNEEKTKSANPTTVIVEGDGSTIINVYYDRKEYEIKFYYAMQSGSTFYVASNTNGSSGSNGTVPNANWNSSVGNAIPKFQEASKDKYVSNSESIDGKTYYYFTISAKYNADISTIWPSAPFEVTNSQRFVSWGTQYGSGYNTNNSNKNIKGVYSRMDSNLIIDPNNSLAQFMVGYWKSSGVYTWTYNIYYESLDGTGTLYNKLYYKEAALITATSTEAGVSHQTAIALPGVTCVGVEAGDGNYEANFYYSRNKHTLTFDNHSDTLKLVENVPYGAPLSNYVDDSVLNPDYPSTLEPNAYQFNGWYLAPNGQGEKINLENTNLTMPDSDYTLYAYWKPVTHTVKFHNQYTDIANGNVMNNGTFVVNHGDVITGTIPTPSIDGYTFIGWFYMLDGEKVAFKPTQMDVMRDLNLFAEWTSSIVVDYKVHYVKKGTTEKIADSTIGKGFAGQTKTFTAKTDVKLYADFQNGWYPVTSSHSIVLERDTVDQTGNNEYTFEYIHLDNVPYVVNYINKQTGEILHHQKVVDPNAYSVVTEKFEPVTGYIPDAYYKRLVLSATPSENVINFYYVPDTEHAYYVIHHMIEELDGSYTDYAVIEGIGDLNKTVSADPLTIDGFTYSAQITTQNAGKEKIEYNDSEVVIDNYKVNSNGHVYGTLKEYGLKLKLYYQRNTVGYTVQYLEYGTNKVLATAITGTEPYGKVLEFDALDISGYTLISTTPAKLEIRGTAADNILTFYYQVKRYVIRYIPVCSESAINFGGVSIGMENVINTAAIMGSDPKPAMNFEFVGWYLDAACTQPVDSSIVEDDGHIQPKVAQDITYYALFSPMYATLKISKNGVDHEDLHESFLFKIQGKDTNNRHISMVVSVQGNDSLLIERLPLGSYEVTELVDWSFRYGLESGNGIVELKEKDSTYEVTFTNKNKNLTWLGEEASNENNFSEILE